jgi:sterol desaturase/sphingolipid hydroxylase (fatty acid hydroxylase superfamily)
VRAALDLVFGVVIAFGTGVLGRRIASWLGRLRDDALSRCGIHPDEWLSPVTMATWVRFSSLRIASQAISTVLIVGLGIAALALIESVVNGPSWAETASIWLVVAGGVIGVLIGHLRHVRARIALHKARRHLPK